MTDITAAAREFFVAWGAENYPDGVLFTDDAPIFRAAADFAAKMVAEQTAELEAERDRLFSENQCLRAENKSLKEAVNTR